MYLKIIVADYGDIYLLSHLFDAGADGEFQVIIFIIKFLNIYLLLFLFVGLWDCHVFTGIQKNVFMLNSIKAVTSTKNFL